jgi:hypothetical protein
VKHSGGKFLHGGRWVNQGELERLRRSVELGDDPEARESLLRAEKRRGVGTKPRRTGEVPNLDDMSFDGLVAFWRKYSSASRAEAKDLVGDRPGYMKYTKWLANYAWHRMEAYEFRVNGAIPSAVIAERFADSVYSDLPDDLKW